MNIRRGLFTLFFICGLLLIIFTSFGQQKHISLKVYLILNNHSQVIKNDSLFESGLRIKLSNLLKKKNIMLVPNEETETYEQSYIYIKVVIADSLRISEWKSIAPQGNGTIRVLPKENVYEYKDEKDIIKKVISYAKRNL
ncbi:MAG: hypothetical protein ABR980_01870 [Ignavibacteriaceae bacterium]|jgi:hypothetical protein